MFGFLSTAEGDEGVTSMAVECVAPRYPTMPHLDRLARPRLQAELSSHAHKIRVALDPFRSLGLCGLGGSDPVI
jgi:hypothetical protein